MPTYVYRCKSCRKEFEVEQRITEPALTDCQFCEGKIERLISGSSFVLKGTGWYKTDYARGSASETKKTSPVVDKPAGEKPKENTETTAKSVSSNTTSSTPTPASA